MSIILPTPSRTSVRPDLDTQREADRAWLAWKTAQRREELRQACESVAAQNEHERHFFVAQAVDPVSCFWCQLPRANGRHRP